jgi:hypothetical protein
VIPGSEKIFKECCKDVDCEMNCIVRGEIDERIGDNVDQDFED